MPLGDKWLNSVEKRPQMVGDGVSMAPLVFS